MGLDQIVFEEDRLELVVGGHEIDRFDFLHQGDSERITIALSDHVGPDTVPKISRLADVDHLSLGVLVQIDAGPVGKLLDSSLQALDTIGHGELTTLRCASVILSRADGEGSP